MISINICLKHRQKRLLFGCFFALFTLNCAFLAFSDPAPLFNLPQNALYGGLGGPDDPVPAITGLRYGKLPNGLRYYILENSLPSGRAYLTLAVNAGSVLENDNEQGLAHFLEHMAFNGTTRFPGAEIVNYLRSLGMRFGPEVNAYTSFDETVYGIETPTEQGEDGIKRIPEKALAILDDWTHAITLDPLEVDKERLVILEEYRSRLGARDRIWRQIMPVIFRGSPYAQRLPIGIPEIIQNAKADDLRTFYRRWYRPDNMAVILVGDFDGAVMEKSLTSHFNAPLPDSPLARPQTELPKPEKGALNTVIVTDPELPFSTVYLYFKQAPKTLTRTLQTFRQNIIENLLELMTEYRFSEMIAAGDTPYIEAGAWKSRYGYSSSFYILGAQSKADAGGSTLGALLYEKERLRKYGFTQTELNRAKRALLSNMEMMEAEKDRQESADYIDEFTSDYLHEQFSIDPEWELEAVRRMLPAISLLTVNAALRSFFIDNDQTIIITAPETEAASLPNKDDINTMIQALRTARIDPLETKTAGQSLIDQRPQPGKIVSTRRDDSGAEIWELSNGMKLVLMETANKNNELEFYALARGGTTSADGAFLDGFSPAEERFSAELAAEIQGASGLGNLSRGELMDYLYGKQLNLSFWASTYSRGIRGNSSVKDLPVLFELLYASFTQPRVDEVGLWRILEYYNTKLLQEADNPEAVFLRELSRLLYNNHPLLVPMEIEDLNSVNAKAALAFLTKALNPADYALVLAGSLGNRETLRGLTETWLASIPQGSQWNEWAKPDVKLPKKTEKTIYKGKEDKSAVYFGWLTPKPWTEYDNAAALVLSEYLDIVLNDAIREKLGGVYSISSRASLNPMPKGELSLAVYFVCGPAREEELRDAVRKQIASLADGAIDGETLVRSKEALVKSFERSMESNSFIARNMAFFTVISGEPLFHLAQRPALYRSVTAEQIRRIVSELLEGEYIELILLPEERI